MTDLTFEEQDLIIDKLIEKYLGGHKGCGNSLTINHPVFCMVTFIHPTIDWGVHSPNVCEDKAAIEFDVDGLGVFVKEYTIQELQRKYFQDILSAEPMRTKRKINKFLFSQHSCNLTPTQNELIMFELTEGFEYPLQDKFLKKEQTNE